MIYKEEITKLIMASYDRGVADAKQAAMETFTVAINAAVRVEREACAKVCEELHQSYDAGESWEDGTYDCAAAIRARGNI
jgi:hypothetical protein